MTHYSRVLLLGAVCLAAASGATITVQNASFETANALDQPCSGLNCNFNQGDVPGWTKAGTGGSWQTGNNTVYFDFLPDGNFTAYLNTGALRQTTSEVVQLGLVYVLQVDIGHRKGYTPTGGAALKIGDTLISAIGSVAAEGGWSTYTAFYEALAGDVGKSISIELFSFTASELVQQGNFDNVRLSSEIPVPIDPEVPPLPNAVPEPGTVSLIGLGVASVVWKRRQ